MVVFATPVKGCAAICVQPKAVLTPVITFIGVGLYHKVAVFATLVPVIDATSVMMTSKLFVF